VATEEAMMGSWSHYLSNYFQVSVRAMRLIWILLYTFSISLIDLLKGKKFRWYFSGVQWLFSNVLKSLLGTLQRIKRYLKQLVEDSKSRG
jgi:hypothetical protein